MVAATGKRGSWGQKAGVWKESVVWVAELSEDLWGDGARCPELLSGVLGIRLGVQPPQPCPWSTGHQALCGLVTLSDQSQEPSGRAALGHLQPAPGSLSSPTFAPDQLLQLILQGWNVYGGSLYYFSHVKKSWHEAERFCVSQGAHLASVTSEEEQVRVAGLVWC